MVSGKLAAVDSVAWVDSSAKVYNFEVADWHNYFVGAAGALVHNTCPGESVTTHGLKYQPKVFDKMKEGDLGHSFSFMLDDIILKSGVPHTIARRMSNGDIVYSTTYRSAGTLNGSKGWYEIGVDANNEIMHRSFNRRPDVGSRKNKRIWLRSRGKP